MRAAHRFCIPHRWPATAGNHPVDQLVKRTHGRLAPLRRGSRVESREACHGESVFKAIAVRLRPNAGVSAAVAQRLPAACADVRSASVQASTQGAGGPWATATISIRIAVSRKTTKKGIGERDSVAAPNGRPLPRPLFDRPIAVSSSAMGARSLGVPPDTTARPFVPMASGWRHESPGTIVQTCGELPTTELA